jgi:external thioesterase TEII
MLCFFLPILRADFEIIEKNISVLNFTILTPIFAIMGKEEEDIEHITDWSTYTSSTFSHKIFEGGHFFIFEHANELASILKKCGSFQFIPE